MKAFPSKPIVLRLLGAVATLLFAAQLNAAYAVTVGSTSILPNAVSYEYFGLNFQVNVQTSNTVGTLDYTGQPGCGGICKATTKLGSSPSVSAQVNEITFNGGAGGVVQASLGYYVAYINSPGTYNVNLHATHSISEPDGRQASAYVGLGQAGANTANLNNFASKTFEEAECVNGCPNGFGFPTGPFADDHLVSMEANTLYYVELDLLFRPDATNLDVSAMIDPIFSASGGRFIFSPGVFSPGTAATPLPAALLLFISGLGGLSLLGWRRRA